MTTVYDPTTIASGPTRLRRLVPATLIAAAIALGAMGLAAPAANAKPISENTIKKECKAANGGKYSTVVMSGVRYSFCDYTDSEGNSYTDYYENGEYYHTQAR